jgi:hypothetical protein
MECSIWVQSGRLCSKCPVHTESPWWYGPKEGKSYSVLHRICHCALPTYVTGSNYFVSVLRRIKSELDLKGLKEYIWSISSACQVIKKHPVIGSWKMLFHYTFYFFEVFLYLNLMNNFWQWSTPVDGVHILSKCSVCYSALILIYCRYMLCYVMLCYVMKLVTLQIHNMESEIIFPCISLNICYIEKFSNGNCRS